MRSPTSLDGYAAIRIEFVLNPEYQFIITPYGSREVCGRERNIVSHATKAEDWDGNAIESEDWHAEFIDLRAILKTHRRRTPLLATKSHRLQVAILRPSEFACNPWPNTIGLNENYYVLELTVGIAICNITLFARERLGGNVSVGIERILYLVGGFAVPERYRFWKMGSDNRESNVKVNETVR